MSKAKTIRYGFDAARQCVSDPSLFVEDQVWALREMLDDLEKVIIEVTK